MYTDNLYGLAEVHAELLKILTVFHDYCKKNGIDYSVYAGTMLGAVREKGFIPWDDDIDVVMTMDNYLKLQEATRNDKKYFIDLEDAWVPRFRSRNEKQGPFVDLFVFTEAPKGLEKSVTVFKLRALQGMLKKYQSVKKVSIFYKVLLEATRVMGKFFSREFLLKSYWEIGYGKKRNTEHVYVPTAGFRWLKEVEFEKDKLNSGYTEIVFEDTTVEIFKEYDYMLIVQFGKNYMTPVKESERVALHQGQIKK